MKYFILSQPKAGTYLCSNLLVEFGIEQTDLHFSETEYQHYDLDDLESSRKNPRKYTKTSPLEVSTKLINEVSFGVGHLIPSDKNVRILKDFKKILLVRDIDSAKKSMDRWLKMSGRSGSFNETSYKKILGWETQSDVFKIDFTDLITKKIGVIDQLQLFLFDELKINSETALTNALEKDSMTKNA